ncbi:metal ABC transporter ATP-binding protein [Membranihabitans maritimus]|uniref:metal ABC transporter ATP-binding protein n=1 Tax=Membranihabitans maritimus TaxID=2904244 RepID=UPI001F2FBA01|nr:metal ABC transporter ATP-binding protein [Membranihabitans maritimus]
MKERKVAVEAHNITVAYDRQPVLWEVDFEMNEGNIIGIIGPNGSGKTTLIKTLMGVITPDSGYVEVFGAEINRVRDQIAYVPQRESVDWDFPASVYDVVMMGRFRKNNLFHRSNTNDRKIVRESIEKVGMTPYINRQIGQLSGGQQQRVFLARSLAQEADIYFMDEPFVGVDAATESAILELMTTMKNLGKTLIIVHHDLQTVSEYFDEVLLLNTRVIDYGPVNSVLTDDNLKAAYGGQLNVLTKVGDLLKKREFPIREKEFKKRSKS